MAVTVIVEVPTSAVLSAENVRVELPPPGAAIEAVLKAAVTPPGNPETDNETAELNPPVTEVEIVALLEPPWVTSKLAGDALTAKSGAVAASTVIETVAV